MGRAIIRVNKIPKTMQAVLLTGNGGYEKLEFRDDVAVPEPAADEVLIRVGGAGINNTDINTRIGWYSKSVTSDTDIAGGGYDDAENQDGGWSGTDIGFPRIQGADCCGTIVAVGRDVNADRIGQRVLVRTMMAEGDPEQFISVCTGSERDGGFAQFMTTRSHHALSIDSDWSNVELASIPCAYSTAEGLLHRSKVGAETVLVTGASGGVGSAAIQLAKRRGAKVIALASRGKAHAVRAVGADKVLDRDANLVEELGVDSVDVVIDLVAGPNWPQLLEALRRGGRYATSGAIAGPIVELDVRTLYLKDLSFFGCTYQEDIIFENLVKYIEANEIRPLVAKTYPLKDIVEAQQDFLQKKFTGKLVLIPEQIT